MRAAFVRQGPSLLPRGRRNDAVGNSGLASVSRADRIRSRRPKRLPALEELVALSPAQARELAS